MTKQEGTKASVFATFDARRKRWVAEVWIMGEGVAWSDVRDGREEALSTAVVWLDGSKYADLPREVRK